MTNKRHTTSIFLLIVFCTLSLMAAKIWESFHIDNNEGMSNSSVNVIYQDSMGVMWIGTWDGLNRYDGDQFTQYHSITRDTTTLSHPVIRDILEENSEYLWVVSDWGLNRFNKITGHVSRYYLNCHQHNQFSENSFKCAISRSGQVIGSVIGEPLFIFNKETKEFDKLSFDHSPIGTVRQIHFGSDQMLWIVTTQYIYKYRLKNKCLRLISALKFRNNSQDILFDASQGWIQLGKEIYRIDHLLHITKTNFPIHDKLLSVCHLPQGYVFGTDNGYYIFIKNKMSHFLSKVAVTSLLYGSQNILWVGTDGQGLLQYYNKLNYIRSYKTLQKGSPVRAILKEGNKLFIGTKGSGLQIYQIHKNDSLSLSRSLNVGSGRSYNAVFSLCRGEEKDNRIWIGTDGTGLSYYSTGNLHSMKFRHKSDQNKIYSIYSIIQLNDSTLILGTSGNGTIKATYHRNIITKIFPYNAIIGYSIQSDIVYAQLLDYPYLWIGTRGNGLIRLNIKNNTITSFHSKIDDTNSLVSNDIISLHKDYKNRLWIGTTQGLDLMERENRTYKFIHFTDKEGLPNMNIHNIQEDSYHNIWVSTSNGISRIQENYRITTFSYKDGLQGNEFADGAGLSVDGGKKLYFGGTKGFSLIYPTQIQSKGFMPKLFFSALTVDNVNIPLTKSLKIKYGAKSIEFSFSILDYINNDRCELSYKLIRHGFLASSSNSFWNNVANSKNITLNELVPGSYMLYVRQSNSLHQWSSNYRIIPFYISFPLWQRWWAILCYFIIIILFVRYVYQSKKKKLQDRHQREMEGQRQKIREDIHHAKLSFFSNVTGEFSNNITQIYNALEHIHLKNNEVDFSGELDQININVKQMNAQIKRMSEIQSAEEDNLAVTPKRFNLLELLLSSIDNFSNQILDKDINLKIPDIDCKFNVVTDQTILSKIAYNLVNYIMGNIQQGSTLTINCLLKDGLILIEINYIDVLAADVDFSEIFNSYKALDNFESNMSTGKKDYTIGLTISNDLAKRLGGNISIKKDNQNITFIITVKETKLGEKEDENIKDLSLEKVIKNKDKNILLIEKDRIMAQFISHILSDSYNVMIVNDKDEFKNNNPVDLVIYDLEEDYHNFLRMLRSDTRTKYVPIVAICNEGTRDNYADILSAGMTTLIEKPFHTVYFKAIIEHSFQDVLRMKEFSTSPFAYISHYGSVKMSDDVKNFLVTAGNTLNNHYSDESYKPNHLAKDMAVSRSQLYKKMKDNLNISPSEFILGYRMLVAENLLKSTDMTISEIINRCGFHNRAYFYREFSKRHHCLPKDFRKNG